MNASSSLLSVQLTEQIKKMDLLLQQLTENNQWYLSTFPEEIALGLNYTLEKSNDFLIAYFQYTTQIQQILQATDTCAAKISSIILQADYSIQFPPINDGDQILCFYHTFVKDLCFLLEETQRLISDPDNTINGSKLIRSIHDFQYKVQQFSALLQEYTIK